jgi:hypothetical protein
MLERNIARVKKLYLSMKARATPSTQSGSAELLREFQELEKYQIQVVELEGQRDVWLAGSVDHMVELERFSKLLEHYKTSLNSCLELSLARQAEARAATGFEGFDEAWRLPTTKQLNHPITHLPLFTEMIQDQLEEARSLHSTLLEALPKPYILDDETLDRVNHNYGLLAADNLQMFGWQLERWLELSLTDQHRLDVQRLQGLLEQYRHQAAEILRLSQRLRAGNIDRVMEKDDLQLGLEYLLGTARKRGEDR